ncbi:Ato2/Ady2 [Kluyveromyces lactis]|nr:Ato2/Ady2 [Kluyveromyces lactis]
MSSQSSEKHNHQHQETAGHPTAAYNSQDPNVYHDDLELQKVQTGGENHEFIFIGRQKFLKDDLYGAFGGTLNPGLAPPATHKFANPAPLGLSAFALTTFVLSMYNARAMGVTVPNVVVSLAVFYGGFVQMVAGVWEIALENTFGGTALTSYGGFWMSFAAIHIPWFGIGAAYEEAPDQLANALGFYLLGWTIFTVGLTVCTMKSTLAFFSLFFLLSITFLLLTIGEFTGRTGIVRAAGVLGVIVAFIAWYNAFAGVATRENSYITVRPFPLPKAKLF